MTGFVAAHRTLADHHLFDGDAARLGAWCWLFMRAAWKPTKYDIRGKTITLERGQLCVSVRQLGEAWGWSKSAVDRFLTRLETETMIEREAGHGKLVITICKYNEYQDLPDSKRDTDRDTSGTPAGHQRDIKEQVNKETREQYTPLNPPKGKVCKPDGVDDQVWLDWLKARRKPPTPTAMKRIENEAAKIGWTLAEAITEASESGWQGFKSDWVREKHNERTNDRRDGVAKALDRRLGLGEYSGKVERQRDQGVGRLRLLPPARIEGSG
jgi:hypothetical protein